MYTRSPRQVAGRGFIERALSHNNYNSLSPFISILSYIIIYIRPTSPVYWSCYLSRKKHLVAVQLLRFPSLLPRIQNPPSSSSLPRSEPPSRPSSFFPPIGPRQKRIPNPGRADIWSTESQNVERRNLLRRFFLLFPLFLESSNQQRQRQQKKQPLIEKDESGDSTEPSAPRCKVFYRL